MFIAKIVVIQLTFLCMFLQISIIYCSLSPQKKVANGDSDAACTNCTIICQYPCHAPPTPTPTPRLPPPSPPPPPPPSDSAEAPPPPSEFQGVNCPPGSVPCCQYPNGPPMSTVPYVGQYGPPSPYTYLPYNNFSASTTNDCFGKPLYSAIFFMYFFCFA